MAKKSNSVSEAMQQEQRELAALGLTDENVEVECELFVVKYALTSGPYRAKMTLYLTHYAKRDGSRAVYGRSAKGGRFEIVRVGVDAFLTEAAAREAMQKMATRKIESLHKQIDSLRKQAGNLATDLATREIPSRDGGVT